MRPFFLLLLSGAVFFTNAGLLMGGPAARSAEASIAIEMTLDRLLQRSHLVVVGTPTEAHAMWEPTDDTGGKRIVTYSRVAIERIVDGHLDRQETWVRTLGGTVDGIGQRVFGEAELELNRPVLLFLRARQDGTHMVAGMAQGEFPLEVGSDGTRRVRSSHGLGALVPPPHADATTLGAQRALSGRGLDEVADLITTRRRAVGATQ